MSGIWGGAGGRGSESYFVPMSDMLAGLLFLFLVMLMTLALYNVGEKMEAAPPQPQPVHEDRATAEARRLTSEILAARSKLIEQIATEAKQRGIALDADPASGLLQLDAALLFERGKVALSAPGREKLAVIADVLQRNLRCYIKAAVPCAAPQAARIELVIAQVEANAVDLGARGDFAALNTFAASRALAFYAGLVEAQPELYAFTTDKNNRALTVQGRAEDAGGTPRKGARGARVSIAVEMIVPPLAGQAEKIGRD